MDIIFDLLDSFFSTKVFHNLRLYDLISMIFRYLFVFVVYYFIFNIIKMITLDIRNTNRMNYGTNTYLKLINRKEKLPFKVQEHYFIGAKNTLGRDDKNQIVLKDRFISKRHAEILKSNGHFLIRDLDSANGTYVNGMRVEDVMALKDRDLIRIGQVEFLFVDGDDEDE